MSAIEIANQVLLIMGLAFVVGAVVTVSRRKRWSSAAVLPINPVEGLTGLDAALVVWLFAFLPSLAMTIIQGINLAALVGPMDETHREFTGSALAMIFAYVIILTVALFVGRAKVVGGWKAWGLVGQPALKQLGWALLIVLMISPVIYGVMYLALEIYTVLAGSAPPEHSALLTLRDTAVPTWLVVLTCVNAVVFAPVVEELVLRGILLPVFVKHFDSAWRGIAVTALLFGLIHWGVPQTIPSLILFGVVLGYAYLKSGSLMLSILIHAVFNLRTVVSTLLGDAP